MHQWKLRNRRYVTISKTSPRNKCECECECGYVAQQFTTNNRNQCRIVYAYVYIHYVLTSLNMELWSVSCLPIMNISQDFCYQIHWTNIKMLNEMNYRYFHDYTHGKYTMGMGHFQHFYCSLQCKQFSSLRKTEQDSTEWITCWPYRNDRNQNSSQSWIAER